jgi:hypothetical protein
MVISGAVILALILLLILVFPNFSGSQDIDELKAQIAEQEALYPLYEELRSEMKRKVPKGLLCPDSARLARGDTGKISLLFENICTETNMKLLKVVPNIESLNKTPGHLSVDARLKGDFLRFRDFLIRLGEMPFLQTIEKIRIQSVVEAKEFTVTAWFALEE